MQLINIQEQDGIQTVVARELHYFLESKQDFSTWIKKRISDYGFKEEEDYSLLHKKMEQVSGAKHSIEYHISIDMAKEQESKHLSESTTPIIRMDNKEKIKSTIKSDPAFSYGFSLALDLFTETLGAIPDPEQETQDSYGLGVQTGIVRGRINAFEAVEELIDTYMSDD